MSDDDVDNDDGGGGSGGGGGGCGGGDGGGGGGSGGDDDDGGGGGGDSSSDDGVMMISLPQQPTAAVVSCSVATISNTKTSYTTQLRYCYLLAPFPCPSDISITSCDQDVQRLALSKGNCLSCVV